MVEIFVNLKRFDVPKRLGGICLHESPQAWVKDIITQSVQLGLGQLDGINLTYLFPEALLLDAINQLHQHPPQAVHTLNIGCQGVFREDVVKGGNFGAFTSNLPASAAKNLGCSWAMIGHSEERKDKFSLLEQFDPSVTGASEQRRKANQTLDTVMNQEVQCAFKADLNVLLCIGETAEERGDGTFHEQQPRIEAVLRSQLKLGLRGVKAFYPQKHLVIGYEPRWAIGPGKTPPGAEYIGFVSAAIKSTCQDLLGAQPPVVYGGGLKEDNAAMIAGIDTIDGGLVALTQFTGDIAFEPEGLAKIIKRYIG